MKRILIRVKAKQTAFHLIRIKANICVFYREKELTRKQIFPSEQIFLEKIKQTIWSLEMAT
jgi:hypothetical protein